MGPSLFGGQSLFGELSLFQFHLAAMFIAMRLVGRVRLSSSHMVHDVLLLAPIGLGTDLLPYIKYVAARRVVVNLEAAIVCPDPANLAH
jgi:hypothetical protein